MCFWLKTKQEAKSHSLEGWENQPHHAQSLSTPLPPSLPLSGIRRRWKPRAVGSLPMPETQDDSNSSQPAGAGAACWTCSGCRSPEVPTFTWLCAVDTRNWPSSMRQVKEAGKGKMLLIESVHRFMIIWKSDLLTKTLRFQRNCSNCGRICKLYLIFLSLRLPPKKGLPNCTFVALPHKFLLCDLILHWFFSNQLLFYFSSTWTHWSFKK